MASASPSLPLTPEARGSSGKLAQTYDVLMVDADFDQEYALGIVENLCAGGQNYVMAYSSRADMKLAVRFMRAGVREFFTLPIDAMELTAALKLAVKNRDEAPPLPAEAKSSGGKLFVLCLPLPSQPRQHHTPLRICLEMVQELERDDTQAEHVKLGTRRRCWLG